MLTADSTGSGEKTTPGKKGILCRIKSIQICIIIFLASLGLETCSWHLKPQNLTEAFCCSVLVLLQIFVQGCPPVIHQIFPSHPVLATRCDKVPWRRPTQQEFLWMDRGAFFHCWLSQHLYHPSFFISYTFQSFPSHLIQCWSQPLPGNTLAAPLHSSKSWTNAGSLSLKVLQYFPTIRFHSLVKWTRDKAL